MISYIIQMSDLTTCCLIIWLSKSYIDTIKDLKQYTDSEGRLVQSNAMRK